MSDFLNRYVEELATLKFPETVDKPVNNFLMPSLDRTEPANQKDTRVQTTRLRTLEAALACKNLHEGCGV